MNECIKYLVDELVAAKQELANLKRVYKAEVIESTTLPPPESPTDLNIPYTIMSLVEDLPTILRRIEDYDLADLNNYEELCASTLKVQSVWMNKKIARQLSDALSRFIEQKSIINNLLNNIRK